MGDSAVHEAWFRVLENLELLGGEGTVSEVAKVSGMERLTQTMSEMTSAGWLERRRVPGQHEYPARATEYAEALLRERREAALAVEAERDAERELMDQDARDAIRRLLGPALGGKDEKISRREAYILVMRYGLFGSEPLTSEEVGEVVGVTRERIYQIERKVIKILRHPSRSRGLWGLLDGQLDRRSRVWG